MSIRDRIIKAELGSEIVSIPEWDVKIEVREQTVDQQFAILDRVRKSDGDIDTKLAALEAVLVTSYDPDTGEPVFEAADRDMLRQKSAKAFSQLFRAASQAAGLETEDEVVSDLADVPTDETSTS